MFVYPPAIDASSVTLEFLAAQGGSIGWRGGASCRRTSRRLLVLVQLCCGEAYTRLTRGFGMGMVPVARCSGTVQTCCCAGQVRLAVGAATLPGRGELLEGCRGNQYHTPWAWYWLYSAGVLTVPCPRRETR